MSVVLDGIEPSFPACKTGVVAVGPQDCVCRSGEYVPKDFFRFVLTFEAPEKNRLPYRTDLDGTCKSPDLLVWNQQCYRYTKDVFEVGTQGIAPLADYHTIKGRRVTTSRVETLPSCSGGSRGTRTHNGLTRSCFQDSVLIRPGDFRVLRSLAVT